MERETKNVLIIGAAAIAGGLGYLYLRKRAAAAESSDQAAIVDLSQQQTATMPSFDDSSMPVLAAPALASLDELIAALDGDSSPASGSGTSSTSGSGTGSTSGSGTPSSHAKDSGVDVAAPVTNPIPTTGNTTVQSPYYNAPSSGGTRSVAQINTASVN